MEYRTNIQYLNPEPNRRVVAVSDIHGHKDWLERLLRKVGFGEKDILIIVGDMIEKGPQSLETIRYVMGLQKTYAVYPVIGNVDLWRLEMLLAKDGSLDEVLYETNREMLRYWESTFFKELCGELNLAVEKPEDISGARTAILEHFQEELEFLKGLPTILETPGFTFVHGGLVHERVEDNLSVPPFELLKNDDYLNQGKHFQKYLVAGHWPVCLYDPDRECFAPVVNEEQKIISIDGGCGVKENGQLNALLIPDIYGKQTAWDYVDGFLEVTAPEDQIGSEKGGGTAVGGTGEYMTDEQKTMRPVGSSINIRYFESQVKILEAGSEFSLAEHVKSGYRLWIYNAYLDRAPVTGELNDCWAGTDYLLDVKAGETLALIYASSRGCLMKKEGVVGWYCR